MCVIIFCNKYVHTYGCSLPHATLLGANWGVIPKLSLFGETLEHDARVVAATERVGVMVAVLIPSFD